MERLTVGILTSSRADYGIYKPLLNALEKDAHFDLQIIVFGTHLIKKYGNTITEIEQDGYSICAKIDAFETNDTPLGVAKNYANVSNLFADFWEASAQDFDLIFALGDRFEMAAAVNASIPFGIKIAHLYAGDTTLGAIDNIYRDQISLVATHHFCGLQEYADRVQGFLPNASPKVIGALSLLGESMHNLLSKEEFQQKWNIDLHLPTILVTVHPETKQADRNRQFVVEISKALQELCADFQIVITMPNADTLGSIYRKEFEQLAEQYSSINCIENFGVQSYFTCMQHAKLLIGNTSSGVIEAAQFQKYVLNLGDRQKGRIFSKNGVQLPFDAEQIIKNARKYSQLKFTGENIYYRKDGNATILDTLLENG